MQVKKFEPFFDQNIFILLTVPHCTPKVRSCYPRHGSYNIDIGWPQKWGHYSGSKNADHGNVELVPTQLRKTHDSYGYFGSGNFLLFIYIYIFWRHPVKKWIYVIDFPNVFLLIYNFSNWIFQLFLRIQLVPIVNEPIIYLTLPKGQIYFGPIEWQGILDMIITIRTRDIQIYSRKPSLMERQNFTTVRNEGL